MSTKIASKKKRANLLSGSDWLKSSFSIWRSLPKTALEKKKEHPATFSKALVNKLLDAYSRNEGTLLDPFAGSGTALSCGLERGMKVVGFDISSEFRDLFLRSLKEHEGLDHTTYKYLVENSKTLLKKVERQSIDICVTSPPYWDILNGKRSVDKRKVGNYSSSSQDLGNIENYGEFIRALKEIFFQVYEALKENSYCLVNVGDIRKKRNFYPLHMDVSYMMRDVGFVLEDIVIWDRQNDYNNARPLGYPYKFIINKVHEYILTFRKIT